MDSRITTSAQWLEFVSQKAKTLSNPLLADALSKFQLVPGGPQDVGNDAWVYSGDVEIDGDFIPSSWLTVIDGDLNVTGRVSTKIEGGDGNVTLIVFGNLKCAQLDNDWASIIFVTGNATATEWVFAAREDSSMVIGGNFKTPIFIGADIWVPVGGSVEMDYGYGYAVALECYADAYGALQIEPTNGWRELAMRLGLGRGRLNEEDLMQLLEERLYTTGNLLPV